MDITDQVAGLREALAHAKYGRVSVDQRELEDVLDRVSALEAELKALGEQEPITVVQDVGTPLRPGRISIDLTNLRAGMKLYTRPAPKVPDGVLKLFDDAVEAARLLGHRQADKLHGIYTKESSMCEVAHYQSIDKRRAELRAMLSATQAKEGKNERRP